MMAAGRWHMRQRRHAIFLTIAGVAGLMAMGPAFGRIGTVRAADGSGSIPMESSDQQFLDGLLQRHLYRLADSYCQMQWSDSGLPHASLVDLASGWIRTCTLQALDLPEVERGPWWEKAETIEREFQQRAPELARGLLVRLQLALCQLAHVEGTAELALHDFAGGDVGADGSVSPARANSLQTLRDLLRKSTRHMLRVEESVNELLAAKYERRSRPRGSEGWTIRQLESLRRGLALDLARARRLQASLYPAGSGDRANALDLALGRLRNLAQSTPVDAEGWQARIEMLVCYRMLGQVGQAEKLLDWWDNPSAPRTKARLLAERMLLMVARKELDPKELEPKELGAGSYEQAFRMAGQLLETKAEWREPETDSK